MNIPIPYPKNMEFLCGCINAGFSFEENNKQFNITKQFFKIFLFRAIIYNLPEHMMKYYWNRTYS